MFARSFTLQDICLIGIVRDIDYFVYKKTIPQKHVDFLFRVYSEEVLSKLEVLKKSVSEDCMLWLLNPHVKKVNVPSDFQSERVIQKLKTIGFGITSLDFTGMTFSRISHRPEEDYEKGKVSLNLRSSWFADTKVNEDVLNSLVCCMPGLVHLNLTFTSCSDETLVCIQKTCRNLEFLNVSYCYKITNRGMENLCRGKLLLKNLNVKGTHVDYSGIVTVLDGMPSLECIEYHTLAPLLCKIGNKKQYNLKELAYYNRDWSYSIGPTDDSKIIQACVEMFPKLKKLHFKHDVSQNVLNTCTYFQDLEELKIKMDYSYFLKISNVLTPILPISKNLKTLILSCVSLSLVTLVECFKNLKKLYLKKVSFTPFVKEDIQISKTSLLTIIMKDIDMVGATYEGVISLISLSKDVSKLYLNHMYLPPEIFDIILESMKNLSVVNFQFTEVDMQYVNPFFEVSSMSTVVVSSEDIAAVAFFRKSASCTLSWRNMCDFDNNHTCKSYYNGRERDESDILSDQCDCFDDEIDDDRHDSHRDYVIDSDDYPSD